jgi:DNA-binding beta-propeller fold protein YncE
VDPISNTQKRYPGPEANTVESPHLATGDNGLVYMTDPEGGRVLVYSSNMQPMAQLGGKGSEPGKFSRTLGVAISDNGSIVVSDPDLCRVTLFSALP